MIRYECDKCGAPLTANDSQRYIVKIEVYAAAGPVELDLEPSADTKSELDNLLNQLQHADPDEVEDQTYRVFRFDLCNACRRVLIKNPLG